MLNCIIAIKFKGMSLARFAPMDKMFSLQDVKISISSRLTTCTKLTTAHLGI